ncbi:hypothetical protein EVA_12671 [gut metagenome]|uniref:Uncharacterized protein n=1 Tax=gut metagenome TaxID=749906 RepID=J9FXE9_9ZZZZ
MAWASPPRCPWPSPRLPSTPRRTCSMCPSPLRAPSPTTSRASSVPPASSCAPPSRVPA